MALGKKVSPAKFLGAVSLGLGVAQGATQIIGGIAERRRLKGEMQRLTCVDSTGRQSKKIIIEYDVKQKGE